MKWFRLWTDVRDDVKMLQLSDYEFRMWVYLMSYASDINSLSGDLQITFKLLSLHFHQRFNLFSRAIETFQRLELISLSDTGNITLNNWKKRQFKSDDAYARVKKFRDVHQEKKRFRNGNETAPDTDTDTDTEKEKKKRKTPPRKKLTDEEWLESLKSNPAYANLDIIKVKGKCEAWYQDKGKGFTRARLLNWLNREEQPIKTSGGNNGNGFNTNRGYSQTPTYPTRGGQRQPAELPEEVVSLLRAAEQAATKTKAARDSGEKPQ